MVEIESCQHMFIDHSVLLNVDSNLDSVNVFDMEYKFNQLVNHISIDGSRKAITSKKKKFDITHTH